MLRVQAAALVMARAARLMAELEMMKAENQKAYLSEHPFPYGEEQYARAITDSKLGEEEIYQLYNNCEDKDANLKPDPALRQVQRPAGR